MSKGYVYVLSNASMPGLVKIGWSKHGGLQRAAQLFTTGIPMRFQVGFEINTPDAEAIEKRVHKRLSAQRANDSREFFAVTLDMAVKTIIEVFVDLYWGGKIEYENTDITPEVVPEPEPVVEVPESIRLQLEEERRARTRETMRQLRELCEAN